MAIGSPNDGQQQNWLLADADIPVGLSFQPDDKLIP
jgi:hypothetical protein